MLNDEDENKSKMKSIDRDFSHVSWPLEEKVYLTDFGPDWNISINFKWIAKNFLINI